MRKVSKVLQGVIVCFRRGPFLGNPDYLHLQIYSVWKKSPILFSLFYRESLEASHVDRMLRYSSDCVDCEQSLIFLCKIIYCTRNPSTRAALNEGVSPRIKNKRLLTRLFCLGTTKLSRQFN